MGHQRKEVQVLMMAFERHPANAHALKMSIAFVVILLVVVALDLWSKVTMMALLAPAQRVIELTPFFNLCLSYNPGISFGLFPAESDFAQATLIGFALLAAAAFIWLGLRSRHLAEQVGFALIAGGAIGNALDRAGDGLVTDFLDLHAFGWHWPTFNIADVAITGGVVALVAATFIFRDFDSRSEETPS